MQIDRRTNEGVERPECCEEWSGVTHRHSKHTCSAFSSSSASGPGTGLGGTRSDEVADDDKEEEDGRGDVR